MSKQSALEHFAPLLKNLLKDHSRFSTQQVPSIMSYMCSYSGFPCTEEAFNWLKNQIVEEFCGNLEPEWQTEEQYLAWENMTFDKYIQKTNKRTIEEI